MSIGKRVGRISEIVLAFSGTKYQLKPENAINEAPGVKWEEKESQDIAITTKEGKCQESVEAVFESYFQFRSNERKIILALSPFALEKMCLHCQQFQ